MKNKIFNRFIYSTFVLVLLNFIFLMSSCENDDKDKFPDGVTRIYIKTYPKVAFALDAPLNLAGLVLTIERGNVSTDVPFENFEKEKIKVEPANGTILTFENYSLTITHEPSGKGVVQPIDVTNNIGSLTVNAPIATEYEVADTLKLNSLVINLVKENGESQPLAFADFDSTIAIEPAHGSLVTEDTKKVVVTYLPTKVKMEIAINVKPFRPESAVVKTQPTKLSYGIGEKLDLNGLVMEYNMGGGVIKEIPASKFEAYGIVTSIPNMEIIGKTDSPNLTVTHTASGSAANLTLTIDANIMVKALSVKTLPNTLLYKTGKIVDLSGLVVTITRNDDVMLDIPLESFSKVGLTTSPANGVAFSLTMPYTTISIEGSSITTRSPLKIAIPTSALSVKLEKVSPAKWSIQGYFDNGVVPYIDNSTFTVNSMPNELRGLQWVQATFDLIYITDLQVAGLVLPGAYTVYFVHCNGNTVPDWLTTGGWVKTTMSLKVKTFPFSIYKKEFANGEEVKLYKFAKTSASKAPPYFLILERK